MEIAKLKKFAQFARRSLMEQVSAKLKLVLAENSAARRESIKAVKELEEAINKLSMDQVIERVAYIWFNRFCALRFMDVNRYTRIGVVSPSEGQFQPEILAEAKMGYINEEMVPEKIRQQIFALLDGKSTSRDPQGEAYRLLAVAACNFWNKAMPFLFQRIDDYTELLMPDDLLSGNSILAYTREAMTPDACQDVEVIGWLYQFYISEKKDKVFEGLKKNKKITPENIPAATQLFTPHWIVRYLVENSLGRLWLLNRPDSKLVEQMDYYIRPEQAERNFLRIAKPEEIKICDPACGSGHMLTYAFDLLYAIYEEEGYEPTEIPEKILTHNLYGIEIDERAGGLAAFALTMKARAKQRRFFSRKTTCGEPVEPNICVLENVHFDEGELKNYMDFVGRDLFTAPLQSTLRQFEEADNFGSLIRPYATDVDGMLKILESKNVSGQLFISMTHQKVLQALRQADYLSPKYHVVIANPPYMGNRNLNPRLKQYLQTHFSDVKWDLFSASIVRFTELGKQASCLGFMSPNTWMYLSSHEHLRRQILRNGLITLVELPLSGFEGATVQICAFVMSESFGSENLGAFIRLIEFKSPAEQAPRTLEAIELPSCGWFYKAKISNFEDIPGSPVAYWVPETIRMLFSELQPAAELSKAAVGLQTGDNDRFMRCWHEVSFSRIGFQFKDISETVYASEKWFPYNKGGPYRKWYGNLEFVVNWQNDGKEIRNFVDDDGRLRSRPQNTGFYFKPAITWSEITMSWKSFRYIPFGSIHDVKGQSAFFGSEDDAIGALSWLNSNIVEYLTKVLNPTLSFQSGDYRNLPMPSGTSELSELARRCVEIARRDWDSLETSWEFYESPLIAKGSLSYLYATLREQQVGVVESLREHERLINQYYIYKYGLTGSIRDVITNEQLTLFANPHYRYGNDKSEDELEALLLADTMRELVSYAVGCMFGRYSLDKPGLILANQGETIEDYLRRIPEPIFMPDPENVIPMMEGEWFQDNINIRFREFLRVTFGEEHFEANLSFIEKALGKDLRKYLARDFYTDHVRRYKKRPIYWLFASPKGSFQALIYMHRYQPDTASVVLNKYLREFLAKLSARKSHLEGISISTSATSSEKTKALNEIEKLKKIFSELEDYERKILYPLAVKKVEIDLDDGVKVNYPKFGQALKNVTGLSA